MQEVTFTDLLQRPTETVDKLKSSRRQALRVHRRGNEDDLVLTTASRSAQDDQLVTLAARLLRAVMRDPVVRSNHLLDLLPEVFPWLRFLPDGDRVEFTRELVAVWDASEDIDSPAPVLQLITEWRNTAHVYADPELLEVLRSEVIEDAGAVPGPLAST